MLSTIDFQAKVLGKTTVRINQNGASELWGSVVGAWEGGRDGPWSGLSVSLAQYDADPI